MLETIAEAFAFAHKYSQRQAWRYGLNFYDAEDIAQEVLERVCKRLPVSQQYLAGCVHNKMIDWYRKYIVWEVPNEEIKVSTSRTSVEEEVEYRELERVALKGIGGLAEVYQQVMYLCISGNKGWEIAEILQAPTGTVRCWMSRARARLKAMQ